MKIHCLYDKLVPVKDLISHPKNPNKHPIAQIKRLAQILEYQGWRYPVKVSSLSGFVTSGHGRIEAAKLNGWESVPVNFQEYLSKEQEYADLVSDNSIAEWAEIDFAMINVEVPDLGPELSIDLLGLENFTIDVAEKKDSGSGRNLEGVGLDEDEFDAIEEQLKRGEIRQTPLLSYYGGKQRIARRIIPLIPKHTVYVEPFCGGATLFFTKPWPKVTYVSHYIEVLNDTNNHIVNFYKQMKENPEKLIESLSFALYSRKQYEESKEIYKQNINDVDPLVAAHALYINSHQSFSCCLSSGWGTGVFGANPAKTFRNKIETLPSYMDRLAETYIECDDAINVIKRWDSPQTFFYLDPPYPGTDQGSYKGYSQQHFDALVDCLKTIQGSFVLSCYAQSDMPKEWEHFQIETFCSSSGEGKTNKHKDRAQKATAENLGDRKRVEHLWKKKAKPVREEIQKLYDSGAFDCFTG